MNDLPQNELFSAYLDGELSAAEQAEMERLLATSPAARQLLDELRALSTTLQSLPQQKVGEDLSPRVLRVAERRMLAGEEAGPKESASEPLVRSIYRRFTTPRILVRLALIAVVVVIIVINDRSRQVERAGDAGREIARAPAQSDDKTKSRDYEPPSISAAPEAMQEKANEGKSAALNKPTAPSAATDEALTELSARRTAPELTDKFQDNFESWTVHGGAWSSVNGESSTHTLANTHAVSDLVIPNAMPAAERDAASPATATPPAGSPIAILSSKLARSMERSTANKPVPEDGSRELGGSMKIYGFDIGSIAGAGKPSVPGAGKEAGQRAEQGEKAGEAGENLLVVRCDMSPEAAEKGTFDKLLIANGISLQDERGQLVQNGEVDKLDMAKAPADAAQNKDKDKDKGDDAKAEPAGAEQVELVYVEATPAQVTATLTGLSAQPEAFPSVSIQPEQDKGAGGTNWQEVVRQQVGNYNFQSLSTPGNVVLKQTSPARTSAQPATESAKAEAPENNLKAPDLSSMANQARAQRLQPLDRASKNIEQRQNGPAVRESAVQSAGENLARSMAAAAAASQRQLQTPNRAQIEQSAQSRAQQQVLFVLHVAGGKQSAIPLAKGQKAAVESNAAKPAKPTAKPAVKPADEK